MNEHARTQPDHGKHSGMPPLGCATRENINKIWSWGQDQERGRNAENEHLGTGRHGDGIPRAKVDDEILSMLKLGKLFEQQAAIDHKIDPGNIRSGVG